MNKIANFSMFFILMATLFVSAHAAQSESNDNVPIPTQKNEVPTTESKFKNLGATEEAVSSFELVGRIFIYLALLVAIGMAITYFFRQGKFMKGIRGNEKILKVSETHMLGNKQFLVVVEYGQRKVLLGVGPGMINKLCFLDPPKKSTFVIDKSDRL